MLNPGARRIVERLYHIIPCPCSGGCAMLPLPGEVPLESCPYCIYYHQLGDGENLNEQTEEQHRGYCKPCHCKSSCHCSSSSPGRVDPQASEPKKRLCQRCWAELRAKLDLIVGSRYFNRGIMIAILINTLSMGIEYHEQVSVCVCVVCVRGCRFVRALPQITCDYSFD